MPAIAHQNKILGNTSGGGSTIKVTTSESTLYGQTVTLSDGTTTMSGTFSGAGECEFTGVMMTGTVTASSGGASTSINVPYFGVYTMSLAFFSATITVTYSGGTCTCVGNGESYTASGSPYTFTVHGAATYTITVTIDGISKTDTVTITTDGQSESVSIEFGTINVTYDNDFRGATVTCSQGGTSISKVAPSGGNTMSFYPPTTGTWNISASAGGSVYGTQAIVSSLSTPVPVNLETIPDGSTKTPTDDVSIWLSCAGIKDKAYTTLSQVIGDSETFNALLGDSNACAYMARSTTFATTLCADQYSMNLIGQYDVCCDALLSDSTWASAIAQSAYVDYVLNVKVPAMTSNTAPSGECFGINVAPSSAYYYAFNGFNNSSGYYSSSASYMQVGDYVGYQFTADTKVCVACVMFRYLTQTNSFKGKIQASVNGAWVDASDEFTLTSVDGNPSSAYVYALITVNGQADSYRFYVTQNPTNASHNGIKVQFYGHASDGEKIHGGNPASGETFYYTEGGTDTPIADPSLLSAGTYTIYSNGLAKDPTDLTADYGKTVRICPNTKEIVVRPDNSLYWWGYENTNLEDTTTANGWSYPNVVLGNPTHNTYDITLPALANGVGSGVGSKIPLTGNINFVLQGLTQVGGLYGIINKLSNKTMSDFSMVKTISSNNYVNESLSASNQYGYAFAVDGRAMKVYAIYVE